MITYAKQFLIVFLFFLILTTPCKAIYENYVNDLPQPAEIRGDTIDIQLELELKVQELVNYGHMAPAIYTYGLGGNNIVFYMTPLETIYTLSIAYPYLSNSLQIQTKAYLETEITNYPPESTGYYPPRSGEYSDFAGERREYFVAKPDKIINVWPPPSINVAVLYSLWAYSYYTEDWDYVTSTYSSLRNIYMSSKDSNVNSYSDLAGVIGFARIAHHLGRTSDYNDAINFAEQGFANGVNFNQFLATSKSHYPTGNHHFTTPIFMVYDEPWTLRTLHFNRDIGSFLNDHSKTQASNYADEINSDVPLWWLTGVSMSHGENAYTTPEISWTNFMIHSYVLGDSIGDLKKLLDKPDRKGDLLYIQKLVAVIEAQPSGQVTTTTIQSTTTTEYTTTSVMTTTSIPEDRPPQWFNLRHNPITVLLGQSVDVLVDWWDDQEIQTIIISENSTGEWIDHVVYG